MMKPILIAVACLLSLSGCARMSSPFAPGVTSPMGGIPAAPAYSCDSHAARNAEPCSP